MIEPMRSARRLSAKATLMVAVLLSTFGVSQVATPSQAAVPSRAVTQDQAAAAAPQEAGIALATGWSCIIPQSSSGYTWTDTRNSLSCASGKQYYITLPQNGLWACSVPVGWTWTSKGSGIGCNTAPSQRYYLWAPETGLSACSVPSGWTWTATAYAGGGCGTVVDKRFYLAWPVPGLWACSVPSGHTYNGIMTNYNCFNTTSKMYYLVS